MPNLRLYTFLSVLQIVFSRVEILVTVMKFEQQSNLKQIAPLFPEKQNIGRQGPKVDTKLIDKATCAAQIPGDYVDKIAECFIGIENITNWKNIAKHQIYNKKNTKAIHFQRCLGRIKIDEVEDNVKKQFKTCMVENNIEHRIEDFLKTNLNQTEQDDLEDLLKCLSTVNNKADDYTAAKDCVQTNYVFDTLMEKASNLMACITKTSSKTEKDI